MLVFKRLCICLFTQAIIFCLLISLYVLRMNTLFSFLFCKIETYWRKKYFYTKL